MPGTPMAVNLPAAVLALAVHAVYEVRPSVQRQCGPEFKVCSYPMNKRRYTEVLDPRIPEPANMAAPVLPSVYYIYIYIYIYIYGYCPHDSTDRGKHPSGGSEHAGSADIVFRFEFNEWSSAMQKPAQVLNPNMYDPTENTQAASAVLTYAVHALISLYCPPQHKFTEALNPPIHDPAAAGEAAVPVQTLMCCSACPCC